MPGTEEIPVETSVQALVNRTVSPVLIDSQSDNSQSSTCTPPDITQVNYLGGTGSQTDTSDPPDLNPEDIPQSLAGQGDTFVTSTETLELNDSNEPPDITGVDDSYTFQQQVGESSDGEDIPIDTAEFQESLVSGTDHSLLSSSQDLLRNPLQSPEHASFLTDPDLDEDELEASALGSRLSSYIYQDSGYPETLQAVAPGDILAVSLPEQPILEQQSPNKRGPGRPKKDGFEPSTKKKIFSTGRTSTKSSIKKSLNIHPNFSGIVRSSLVMDSGVSPNSESPLSQDIPRVGPLMSMPGQIMTSDLSQESADMSVDDDQASTCYSINSEDSSGLMDQGPMRLCALCNCGERSLLGQGDLGRYEPSPNFSPLRMKRPLLKIKTKGPEADEKSSEKGPKPLTWRRHRGPLKGNKERMRSPRRYPHNADEDGMFLIGDELGMVGYPEDVDIAQVFEPTGHVLAHHCCAAWSEGVIQTQDLTLKFVDKAVFAGLSQKCNYCKNYGATINCKIPRCNKKYHYPCASARGCFQDIKTLSLLCPEHASQAETIAGEEALCVICDQMGNINEQLFCTSCGHHYHGSCLHPSVAMTPEVRAGWQCPDCKICQMCRHPGEDSKMLVCDTCDKGYHTFCLKPVMTTIPKNGWKCKNCRVCGDCGSRTPGSGPSSRWHLNYSVCDSCYQQRNKGLSCPVCGKAYRQFTQKAMIMCNICKKHVHAECDETIDAALLQRVKDELQTDYICEACRNRDPEMEMQFPYPLPPPPDDSSNDCMMQGPDDMDMFPDEGSNQLSHDPFMLSEDSISVSSNDIDIAALEKGANQLSSPSHHMMPGEGHGIGSKGGKLSVMSRKKIGRPKNNRALAPEKKNRPPKFGERKRGPKPKIKTSQFGVSSQVSAGIEQKMKSQEDDDDGDDHPTTIILANSKDEFVLKQDVCKSCGSFGKGKEGKLIVCTQCGQCYHPYCVNVKVTKVVLQKGWRCLDCTVCEGCGKPHDEGRLILCDECDISYHIYCLDPPLTQVPKGNWKCKWCVMCVNCGATSAGFGCQWMNNYTQCGPCYSHIYCPDCELPYREGDMVIQCVQCDRWIHGRCDGLRSEDDLERAADYGYHCKFCRPRTGQIGPLPPPPAPPTPPTPKEIRAPTPPPIALPVMKEPEPQKKFYVDGIYLSASGMQHIQGMTIQVPKNKRARKKGVEPGKPAGESPQGPGPADPQAKGLPPTQRLSTQTSLDEEMSDILRDEESRNMDLGESLGFPTISIPDGDNKDDSLLSPTLEGPGGPLLPGPDGVPQKKRRMRRNTVNIGIGGFMVKSRQKMPPLKKQTSMAEESTMQSSENTEDGQPKTEAQTTAEEGATGEKPPEEGGDKKPARKPRRKNKKSQLEESFPSYMQEAFFGRDILDKVKTTKKESIKMESDSDQEISLPASPKLPMELKDETKSNDGNSLLTSMEDSVKPSSSLSAGNNASADSSQVNEDGDGELDPNFFKEMFPCVNDDEEIFDLINNELNDGDLPLDSSDNDQSDMGGKNKGQLLLSPKLHEEFDDVGLAAIDVKTVEDILQDPSDTTANLGSSSQQVPSYPMTGPGPPHMVGMPPHPGQHRPPMGSMEGMHGPSHMGQDVPPPNMPPQSLAIPPNMTQGYGPEYGPSTPDTMSPHYGTPQPSWPQALAQDEDQGEQGASRRNIQKWESDEELGENATISAVLYCNLKHPELKKEYPEWSERVKKIGKIWRQLPSEDKQPYLLQARKNRANSKGPKKKQSKSNAMGPPPPPVQGMYGQQSPDGLNSPISNMPPSGGMTSPLARSGSNPQLMTPAGTPEGHSPGQMIPTSPNQAGMPPRLHHPDQFAQSARPVDMPGGMRPQYPQGMPRPGDPNFHPGIPRPPFGQHSPGQMPPGHYRGPGPHPQQRNTGDPYGANSADPYSHPPGTPMAGTPTTPQQSPSKPPQWPGQGHEDPYDQPVPTPRPMGEGGHISSSPHTPASQSYDPYNTMAGPRPMHPQNVPRPPMGRQHSLGADPYSQAPATPASRQDDPYAFSPSTPGPSESYSPRSEGYMPGQMGSERFQRPPVLQRSISQPVMQDPNMRPRFRAPNPPTSMMGMHRPPGYGDPRMPQQGMMGMEGKEALASQQMFNVAGRRHAHFPFSGMISTFRHNYLGGQPPPGSLDKQGQQVRDILAVHTKKQQEKKEMMKRMTGDPNVPPSPGAFPGEEGPRFPVPGNMPQMRQPGPGMERWPHGQPMVRPPQPMQFRPDMSEMYNMRAPGLPPHIRHPGPTDQFGMRGQVPTQGPDGQRGGPPMMGDRRNSPHPSQTPTSTSSDLDELDLPMNPFDPSQPEGNHGHMLPDLNQGQKPGGSGVKPELHKEGGQTSKQSTSEDEKPDTEDENIADLFDTDGSFDILKIADPSLDMDEDKNFLDLMNEDENKDDNVDHHEKHQIKSEGIKQEDIKQEGKANRGSADFQSKFLEFSQKSRETDGSNQSDDKNKSQIAALLQTGARPLERKDSQLSDTSSVASFGQGHPSPMHQKGTMPSAQVAGQPSPGGKFHQQSPGASPKVMPSPKSNAPSPRTPGVASPFNPHAGQQQSPFSQHGQSPFSPSVSSGTHSTPTTPSASVQSPFGVQGQTSPFPMPPGAPPSSQGQYGPMSQAPTSASQPMPQGQRSPRATITPTNQYVQGTFNQQKLQVPPKGSTLTPTPNSILYGQSPMSQQHMMRGQHPQQQHPHGMMGAQPPFTSQQGPPAPGMEMHPGMDMARHPRPPVSGMPPASHAGMGPSYPGMPQSTHGEGMSQDQPMHYAGQQGPMPPGMYPGPMQQGLGPRPPPGHMMPGQPNLPPGHQPMRMQAPGMRMPVTAATTASAGPQDKPKLLSEKPLLIQELLDQEKQEQERQAQQQAMLQRRDSSGSMEGVRPPGLPPMPPQTMEGPRPPMDGARPPYQMHPGQFRPGDPNWPRMFNPGDQRPPGTPGFTPQMQGPAPGPGQQIRQFGPGMPPMPPAMPPMHGEMNPELERQHLQYEEWLVKNNQYLDMQVKALEQQITKCKRTKKAINARNRNAKKAGKEMSPQDAAELERTTHEQSMLQKQLEGMRKQLRTHQMQTDNYQTKKRERYGIPIPGPEQGPSMSGPEGPQGPPGPPQMAGQPRPPGPPKSSRMTATERQEYDNYMQQRLRQQQQQQVPGQMGPRPPIHTVVEYNQEKPTSKKKKVPKVCHATTVQKAEKSAVKVPKIHQLTDNNPFSEDYQEREQMQKIQEARERPHIPGATEIEGEAPVTRPQMPPFYGEHGPYHGDPNQPGMFPAGPRMTNPGDPSLQQRFPMQGPRFSMDPRFSGERGPFMGPRMPLDQNRMPGPPVSGVPPFQTSFGPTPSANLPPSDLGSGQDSTGDAKPKPKKRKKKKKPAENGNGTGTNVSNTAVEPRPPIQFTPQSETEKRIMEILNSTANIQKAQQEKNNQDPPKPSTDKKSGNKAAAEDRPAQSPLSSGLGMPSNSSTQSVGAQSESKPSTSAMQTSESAKADKGKMETGDVDKAEDEPILPMNVMIHQQLPVRVSSTDPAPSPSSTSSGPRASPHHAMQPPHGSPRQAGMMGMAEDAKSTSSYHGQSGGPDRKSPHPASSHTSPRAGSHASGSPRDHSPRAQNPSPRQSPRQSPMPPFHMGPERQNSHPGGPPPYSMAPERQSPHSVHSSYSDHHSPHPGGVSAHERQSPRMMHGPQDRNSPRLMPQISGMPHSPRQFSHGTDRQSPRQMVYPGSVNFDPQGTTVGARPPHLPQYAMAGRMSPRAMGSFPLSMMHGSMPRHPAGPLPSMPYQGPPSQESLSHSKPPMSTPTTSGGPPQMQSSAMDAARQWVEKHQPIVSAVSSASLSTGTAGQSQISAAGKTDIESSHVPVSADSMKSEPTHMVPPSSKPSTEQNVGGGSVPETTEKAKCTDGIHCNTPPPSDTKICEDGIHCNTPPPSGKCTDGIHCNTPPPNSGCTDGIHCNTPPPNFECTDGIHCNTPPPNSECTDGIHCNTPPPIGKCTDGIHCNTPPPNSECMDGIHCNTPPPSGKCTDGIHCNTPPPNSECTDGIHCNTPPPNSECTDGIHCNTPPPSGKCTDGIHCNTPPPNSECTDGIHCNTPPPNSECTDGIHCNTPPPSGKCTDGIHCNTPPPNSEYTDGIHCNTPPPSGKCTDGIHCNTPPPNSECTDGIHCNTPPPIGKCADGIHCNTPPPSGKCTDGIHCNTPPPSGKCTDGIHCNTPPPNSECTDGIHCNTPPPSGKCTDGIHCNTPPPNSDCTDGIHCNTPPPSGKCTDGIHCNTPPPSGKCTDGIHCNTPPPNSECTDGIHCNTPPPSGKCTDGIHCNTPPPNGNCTDGIHCNTPPPNSECTDGIHCNTPPPNSECTDGIHCNTPPPNGNCTDGIHCNTPPPSDTKKCVDGIHCNTPPPGSTNEQDPTSHSTENIENTSNNSSANGIKANQVSDSHNSSVSSNGPILGMEKLDSSFLPISSSSAVPTSQMNGISTDENSQGSNDNENKGCDTGQSHIVTPIPVSGNSEALGQQKEESQESPKDSSNKMSEAGKVPFCSPSPISQSEASAFTAVSGSGNTECVSSDTKGAGSLVIKTEPLEASCPPQVHDSSASGESLKTIKKETPGEGNSCPDTVAKIPSPEKAGEEKAASIRQPSLDSTAAKAMLNPLPGHDIPVSQQLAGVFPTSATQEASHSNAQTTSSSPSSVSKSGQPLPSASSAADSTIASSSQLQSYPVPSSTMSEPSSSLSMTMAPSMQQDPAISHVLSSVSMLANGNRFPHSRYPGSQAQNMPQYRHPGMPPRHGMPPGHPQAMQQGMMRMPSYPPRYGPPGAMPQDQRPGMPMMGPRQQYPPGAMPGNMPPGMAQQMGFNRMRMPAGYPPYHMQQHMQRMPRSSEEEGMAVSQHMQHPPPVEGMQAMQDQFSPHSMPMSTGQQRQPHPQYSTASSAMPPHSMANPNMEYHMRHPQYHMGPGPYPRPPHPPHHMMGGLPPGHRPPGGSKYQEALAAMANNKQGEGHPPMSGYPGVPPHPHPHPASQQQHELQNPQVTMTALSTIPLSTFTSSGPGGPVGMPPVSSEVSPRAGMQPNPNVASPVRTPSRTPSRASSNPSPHSAGAQQSSTSPAMKVELPGGQEGTSRPMSASSGSSLPGVKIKEEPMDIVQKLAAAGIHPEDYDPNNPSQNALLKQLLANSAIAKQNVAEDSEEGSPVQLTPEQQKQLEMIERMPLLMESEVSSDEWLLKSPDEKERLLAEMKKQEFERKRKEYEEARKSKKKNQGEPRKRKKKNQQAAEGTEGAPPGGQAGTGTAGGPEGTEAPAQPPKKRPRKKAKASESNTTAGTDDSDSRVESFLRHLHSMPVVSLQEPLVGCFLNVCPLRGSPAVLGGESQLKGSFGGCYLEGVADFYGSTLLDGLPPLTALDSGTLKSGESEEKQKTESQESQAEKTGGRMIIPGMQSIPGMFGGPMIAKPVLPPPPRIEPKPEPICRETDSPQTIISSSSPEPEYGDIQEDTCDYPMLKPIDPASLNDDERCSPAMPLVMPQPIKTSPHRPVSVEPPVDTKPDKENLMKLVTDIDLEKKKKMGYESMFYPGKEEISEQTSLKKPFRENGVKQDISVTLTLSAKSAEDIGGVLSTIAELLKIAVPPTYHVSHSHDTIRYGDIHKEEVVNIHSLISLKPKLCRHCQNVVLDGGLRKRKSEFPFLKKEDTFIFKEIEDEEIIFCGSECCERFVFIYESIQPQLKPEMKLDIDTKPPLPALQSPAKVTDMPSPASTLSNTDAQALPSTPTTPNSSAVSTPSNSLPTTPVRQKPEEKLQKKQKRSLSLLEGAGKPIEKKWKGKRYKNWTQDFIEKLGQAPDMPEIEIEVLWKALGTIIVPDTLPQDKRDCAFCHGVGDEVTNGPGRLLNMDIDKYVHLNCALWSKEVYETLNGALMNVDEAYTRGLRTECQVCKMVGATLECFRPRCGNSYHVGCAVKCGAVFFQDKTILCAYHAPKSTAENVLESLIVHRRCYINRNENKQIAIMVQRQQEKHYTLRIGSLILHTVGHLLPHHIQSGKFHSKDFIYAVGYKSSRFYWSMRRLYKRCRYVCSISDKDGVPAFKIQIVEPGFEDITFEDNSAKNVWGKILEPLDKMRKNADLVKIFPTFITGEELFGLTEPSVVRVIESLPGMDQLKDYRFKFGKNYLIEMPLIINPSGCARAEPKLRTHFRRPHTLQSSSSRSLPPTVTGVTSDPNCPYMKQFVHSKSQQYRRLKTEWRTNVYLGRSRIQGLGLYAARELEKHTMVIEYIGDLIRNEVANRREMIYEEQNRGVYMFRIDDHVVVDATMAGGLARYINHSCNPNCVAEVVPFDKDSKIIIITNKRIPKGEELTYDYKFDFEDEQHKIPCCCGAPNCRKWMN